jgi:multidrug efflux pump subunit AcrB
MMITVGWPGATADQMAEQVIKPIETVLTENIPDIDYVKSKARPGQATLNVTLISTVKGSAVPDIWYTVRKTVTDHRGDLPDDVVGPPSTTSSGPLTATSTRSPATAFPIRCSSATPRRCATASRRCPTSPRPDDRRAG